MRMKNYLNFKKVVSLQKIFKSNKICICGLYRNKILTKFQRSMTIRNIIAKKYLNITLQDRRQSFCIYTELNFLL